ncbi:MAG: NADPH-dependent F420 reductase [Myxococcota bacterium]
MRIGIIGAGNVGGTVGTLLADAGHEVLLSSRHPEQLGERARDIGGQCGPIIQAATWGDVIFLAIPFGGTEDLDMAVKDALMRKVVLDASNPFAERDGRSFNEQHNLGLGSGTWTQKRLYGVYVIKAFNTINHEIMTAQAHRDGERLGVPIASDHEESFDVASQLITDCGFDPVRVGAMAECAKFDPGTDIWNSGMTAAQIKAALSL